MQKVAALLRPGGLLALNLRHGPRPPGRRRLFETSADETSDLAAAHGLRTIVRVDSQADFYGRTEVTWTSLAFLNEPPSGAGGSAAAESASPSA
jgi:hypothetical protein